MWLNYLLTKRFVAVRVDSMMPEPNTPHFNWGIDFPGTVTASNYSTWATKGHAPDCTWITFCTSCCPSAGPDCCCVSNHTTSVSVKSKVAHPPDTIPPRVVHWCKHPFCPQTGPVDLPLKDPDDGVAASAATAGAYY